jgi:hypothetical protein
VIPIKKISDLDKSIAALVIGGIIFTSLAWIGDLASWLYLGNGFTLDVVLLVVAFVLTVSVILVWRNPEKTKRILGFEDESEVVDEPSEEISDIPTVEDIKKIGKMDPSVEFFCQSCGEIIGEFDGMCKVCGTLRPSCVVCGGFLSFADTIVQLPCCRNFGHQKHIEEHLKKKKSCPNCEEKITKEDLLLVKPD